MKKKNTKMKIRIASLVLASLCLNSCGLRNEDSSQTTDGIGEAISGVKALLTGTADERSAGKETAAPKASYSDFDQDDAIPEDAVRLELAGDAASFDGESILWEENVLTIREAGSYLLHGSWNGQIVVRANADDNVRLILNGLELTGTMAPLYIRSAKNVCLTLAEGSENTISDTANYDFAEGEDEPDAAVFSKCDLTINGAGTLAVNGQYACGIRSKDDLKIVNGDLRVSAVTDAMKGKDSLMIGGGTLTVESGEDGLKSNNDTDEAKGYVIIDGGDMTIRAGDDAVHGESRLVINGGTIHIETCYEGLEAKKVEIYGGDITINATDDAINAASGSSGDNFDFGKGKGGGFLDQMQGWFGGGDRMEEPPEMPDGGMAMGGQPPEMPDGMTRDGQPPEVPNGMDSFKPDDKNGGRDGQRGGKGGGMPREEPEEGVSILIAGGVIRASGRSSDVIDSNGTFEQTGGVLITESSNMTMYGEPDGILDTNGSLTFSGGTFVSLCRSAGSGYESLFAFPSVSLNLNGGEERITLSAADGTIFLDLTPEESSRALFFASDRLIPGEEYTLTLDGEMKTFTAAEGSQVIR